METWTETYDSKKMKLDGGEVLRHQQGGKKSKVNVFVGSSGEVAVLLACEASLMFFGQDLDIAEDQEHGEVSREGNFGQRR